MNFFLNPVTDVSGQWFVAWRHSELYMTLLMSMWINLMFSWGMDVVLRYHIVLVIINDSLLKRTMTIVNSTFLVICESARWTNHWWCSNLDMYTKDSHKFVMMTFLQPTGSMLNEICHHQIPQIIGWIWRLRAQCSAASGYSAMSGTSNLKDQKFTKSKIQKKNISPINFISQFQL